MLLKEESPSGARTGKAWRDSIGLQPRRRAHDVLVVARRRAREPRERVGEGAITRPPEDTYPSDVSTRNALVTVCSLSSAFCRWGTPS